MRKNNKILTIILLVLFLFLSKNFLFQTNLTQIAVVTTLGIDKVENNYVVSANIIVPSFETGVEKNIVFVEAESTSLTASFIKLSANLKKRLGLSHLGAVVIANNVLEELPLNIILEPILKTKTQNPNAKVLCTTRSAKQILNTQNSATSIVSVTKAVEYEKNATSLKDVVKVPYFKSIVKLPLIERKEESNTLSWGENILFVKPSGEKVMFSSQQVKKIAFFKTQQNYFLNTKDELGEDVFLIKSTATLLPSFYNNIPRLFVKCKVNVNAPNNLPQSEYNTLKQVVEIGIKKELSQAFLLLKEHNLNTFLFENLFEAFLNKEWKMYKNSLENLEHSLHNLELFSDIEVSIKNQITLAY